MNNNKEDFAPPEKTQQRLLQKISKVIAIISLIAAICCGIYLAFFIGDSKVIKASVGATTFFCFMMALVLNTIADTNLPNLTISNEIGSNSEEENTDSSTQHHK